MTIKIKQFRSIKPLLQYLQKLAIEESSDKWVFRGHTSDRHLLKTSMESYIPIVHKEGDRRMEGMLKNFRDGLIRIGITPLQKVDILTQMELARHHGVPAPLLDFTWSPYIALFFAFNRVREQPNEKRYSVLYALNINQLGKQWAKENSKNTNDPPFSNKYNEFLYPGSDLFKNELPEDTFRILPYPSEHSPRMHHQMGLFLYNTLNYKDRSVHNLEGFIEQLEEGFESCLIPNTKTPIIIKIRIPHALISDVFSHLELMNITGAAMMGNADGVADDIWNAYNYRKKIFLRNSE